MLKFGLVSVLLLGIISYSTSNVLEYTDGDFDSKIAEHGIALVKFYAPWCGHCKRLAPEFEAAAKLLKNEDPPVPLIKVDCTVEKSTCEKFKVSGYPTLKIFRNGEVSQDYDGPREAQGIAHYMRGQSGPSVKELKSVKDFEKFINNDDMSVVGFFDSESKLKDSYFKVADTQRDRFRFGYSSEKSVLDKTQYTDDIVVYVPKKLHNSFEPNSFKYDGNYDTEKIKKFLAEESVGLAGVRNRGNMYHFAKKPLVVVYYKIDLVRDLKGSNYWRNRVLKVAKEFKRKVSFAVSDNDEFENELDESGLKERKTKEKALVIAYTNNGRYPLQKDFSVDNLKQFVEDVLADKVEPYIKSEPVPEKQENLKVVVGKNFKEMVMDSDKDVLIEFYAPWCGHCKALAPKYEELANKLANEKSVIIAKMDATSNDIPPLFEVRGYPTIYWVPKSNKQKPIPYQGDREVSGFIKFISEHSTDGLSGYTRQGKKKKQEDL